MKETKVTKQKMNPFNILNGLNYPGQLYSEEKVKLSGLNIYLLLNFIKNNSIGLQLSEYLNENWRIPFYQMYLIAFFTFQRFKIRGVRWIKAEKNIKYDKLTTIQKYYQCNYLTGIEFLKVLPDEEIKRIEDYYKTGGTRNV